MIAAVCTYMVNLCRWGEVEMHFVEPSDRKRFEKFIGEEFRRHGIKTDRDGVLIEDGKFDPKDAPLAGSGWIKHQPRSVHGKPHVIVGDIRKVKGPWLLRILGLERGDLGVVFGGPPCQGYSNAGKRDVMDPRNSLVFEYARMVVELQPQTCVMENVPGITTMVTEDGVSVLDEIAMILERGDFGARDMLRKSMEQQTGIRLSRGRKVGGQKTEPQGTTEVPGDLFSYLEAEVA